MPAGWGEGEGVVGRIYIGAILVVDAKRFRPTPEAGGRTACNAMRGKIKVCPGVGGRSARLWQSAFPSSFNMILSTSCSCSCWVLALESIVGR